VTRSHQTQSSKPLCTSARRSWCTQVSALWHPISDTGRIDEGSLTARWENGCASKCKHRQKTAQFTSQRPSNVAAFSVIRPPSSTLVWAVTGPHCSLWTWWKCGKAAASAVTAGAQWEPLCLSVRDLSLQLLYWAFQKSLCSCSKNYIALRW
jgi:hypothetical protein